MYASIRTRTPCVNSFTVTWITRALEAYILGCHVNYTFPWILHTVSLLRNGFTVKWLPCPVPSAHCSWLGWQMLTLLHRASYRTSSLLTCEANKINTSLGRIVLLLKSNPSMIQFAGEKNFSLLIHFTWQPKWVLQLNLTGPDYFSKLGPTHFIWFQKISKSICKENFHNNLLTPTIFFTPW